MIELLITGWIIMATIYMISFLNDSRDRKSIWPKRRPFEFAIGLVIVTYVLLPFIVFEHIKIKWFE